MTERALLPGEFVVLSLLSIRPMHGYEMVCFLDDEGLTAVCPVEQSTLYTYLRNVESRGYVEWTEERVGQRPPRKTFHLTPSGRDLTHRWLRQPVERIREVRLEFLVKLFFLARSDPEAQRALLAAQIDVCEHYLAHLDQEPVLNDFSRLVLQSKRSAADATLAWLKAYAYQIDHEVAQ